jgi:hydroxyacylglutathione hydrolase
LALRKGKISADRMIRALACRGIIRQRFLKLKPKLNIQKMSTHNVQHIKTVAVGGSTGNMELRVVPMFSDNYGYIVIDKASMQAAVVDPADHEVMLGALKTMSEITLTQVWCTHKHDDHAGGNEAFAAAYPGIKIYGPVHENKTVPAISHPCEDEATFQLGTNTQVRVLFVPCHTRGHIIYFADAGNARVLAAGDTLFTGGCGRFFEGTAAEMLANMDRMRQLPHDTVCCPAHEYTQGNFAFNASIDSRLKPNHAEIVAKREKGEFTVPTTIGAEKVHNLFMRTRDTDVQELVKRAAGPAYADKELDAEMTMTLLREMKNSF